jgi:hypothetical protein
MGHRNPWNAADGDKRALSQWGMSKNTHFIILDIIYIVRI